jgi:hypothetical protein
VGYAVYSPLSSTYHILTLQDLDDTDLSPPLVILDHVQVLREVMTVYESSLSGEETEKDFGGGFKRILDVMVDPAVEMCSSASEDKQRTRAGWDKEVFVLNCLTYLQVCRSIHHCHHCLPIS